MSDLLHQNLNPVQSHLQPKPGTITAAATIVPVTRFNRITGDTPITTIAPPVSGYHELVFVFDAATANAFNTGGNIAVAFTPAVNRPITLCYDPRTKLYYPMAT